MLPTVFLFYFFRIISLVVRTFDVLHQSLYKATYQKHT